MSASLLDIRFILLLAAASLLRRFVPRRHYAAYGALCSGLLLGLAAPRTLLAIGGLTLLGIYPIHRLYWAARSRPAAAGWSRWALRVGVGGLVLLLVLFKAYRFFTVPLLGGPWLQKGILELVGFSYFIFRAIGFLHIQSILPINERAPWALLYYTLFPPTLTSGPIQKFPDFRRQLDDPTPLGAGTLGAAAYRITRGYFRKVCLAFVLDAAVKRLLAVPTPAAWSSALTIALLYLFFYFDFAGYSDIAIGFGLAIGIKVPENFRKPFHATSVTEFWRNWHITLVDWFRDNVFIPLGGMQSSRLRAAWLALLIMVLCGLWHGISWSFAIWGVWHGSLLFAEAVSGSRPIPPTLRHGPRYWSRVAWTNARVAAGSVLFLPSSADILRVLKGFAQW